MQLSDSHFPHAPGTLSDLSGWHHAPQLAFDHWVIKEAVPRRGAGGHGGAEAKPAPYRPSTVRVYRAMFGKYLTWCAGAGLSLASVDRAALVRFLDEAVAGATKRAADAGRLKRQRRAYLHLLDKVYRHLEDLGLGWTNPAALAMRAGVHRGARDNPTRFLSREDRERLTDFLVASWAESATPEANGGSAAVPPEVWIGWRDLALATVVLGTGLKVAEARRLSLNCIHPGSGAVSVPGPGRRQVTPWPEVVPVLVDWRERHRRLGLPAEVLFPPARGEAGRRTPMPLARLHQATIHRRIHALLAAAGVAVAAGRGCAQTLRNSFAGRCFDAGDDDATVADRLRVTQYTAERLRRAYRRQAGDLR